MNPYFLASAAAVAVAAVIVLALFSLPKPTVAPQCSDCDFVIKGPVTAYVNFSYPRNYTKAYLLWGNALARSSTIGEYAWSYPLLITCNDYMFAHVRGGILYATCGSGSISIIRNWYSGPFNTGDGGGGGDSNRPRYLKIMIWTRVSSNVRRTLELRIYVNSSVYKFTGSSNQWYNIIVWYNLQNGTFLTRDPGGTCANVTIKSASEYKVEWGYDGYVDYLYIYGPGGMYINDKYYSNAVIFEGTGYRAEYGVRLSLDGLPEVVVTHIDSSGTDDVRKAYIYWIQLCS